MKRIKLVIIALIVLFVGLSSFKQNSIQAANSTTGLFCRWFEYNGWGDPFDPDSYCLLTSQPGCNSSDGYLCAIYVESDLFGGAPSELALLMLGLDSDCFTQYYQGIWGIIRFREY